VVISFEEWQQSQKKDRPTLKEILLAPEPRFDIPLPKRTRYKLRAPVEFD